MSKLRTLLRTTSLCIRFVNNSKTSFLERITGALSISEINNVLLRLDKITQLIYFPIDLKFVSKKQTIRHSPLLKLMPFLDDNGIIHVEGRLQNSDFNYSLKRSIILAKPNPLLIIWDANKNSLHGGVTLTMSIVNRKFWIVSGAQLAKTIIRKCLQCFKYSAKSSQQITGNLPLVRLNVTRPFKHSGVDYAGPINIKSSTLSSTVITKGYVCVYGYESYSPRSGFRT